MGLDASRGKGSSAAVWWNAYANKTTLRMSTVVGNNILEFV